MGKQVVECMHCGARVEPAFLITSNEVRNMLGMDAVPLDVIYQSYLNQLCVPP